MDEVKRTRARRGSIRVDKKEIEKRIRDFYSQDMIDRDYDIEARLQRYAKYRLWTENAGGPWLNSSDVALPDMQEKSFRIQDTLHNAVMSNRPAINARAMHRINDKRQKNVDNLLDFQFFDEARGELIVGEMAESFLNDGVLTVYVPWVDESRKQSAIVIFDGIPEDAFPPDYFASIIRAKYGPEVVIIPMGDKAQPWDFRVERQGKNGEMMDWVLWKFYTRPDGRLEVVVKGEVKIYDGPAPRVLDYDDVFHPVRAANLQPPGPENPDGAGHVIIRDYPNMDEILRLRKSGFYDLLTKADADKLSSYTRTMGGADDREETQKDDLANKSANHESNVDARSHNTLTRLICFDRYDIDGDGFDEDVMFWYLVEPELLIRAAPLHEMYPTLNPRRPRPFAEGSLFPVKGRRVGISLLEQIEGIHDTVKIIADQTVDANTLGIVPWWFYRPTSSMKGENIRLNPGEGFPLSEPQRDVVFPQIGNPQAQAMAVNLMSMFLQWEDRSTNVGDLQLGGVPRGKSSALRTSQNMQALMAQGEARPQRIVRRFFGVLAEIFAIMHEMNQFFLPKRKQLRINGPLKAYEDPYIDGLDKDDVAGQYLFRFQANALNTSAAALQAALQGMAQTYISALFLQLGLTTPETIYNLARDMALADGIDPAERGYLAPPTPDANLPRITAQEALIYILEMGQMPPMSRPAEQGGWAEHREVFSELVVPLLGGEVDTSQYTGDQARMVTAYSVEIAQKAAEEAQRAQMMANAQAMQQQMGGQQQPGPGAPPQGPPQAPGGQPPISGANEMLDESLPTAGGGANAR